MHFDLHKFIEVAKLVAPMVLPAVGVPTEVTNLVINGITVAEAASASGEKTGDEKKAIALAAVKIGLDSVNHAHPGTVDVKETLATVSDGIDVTVKAINAAKNIPVHTGAGTV